MHENHRYPTIPRLSRKPTQPRELTRFERWAWSPIMAYRIGLTLSYIAMVAFGLSAMFAGIPAFQHTAPIWWNLVWSLAVILGGAVAALGSVADSKVFRRAELAGSWVLFVSLGAYAAVLLIMAYGWGDSIRVASSAGFVALGVMPGVRMLWLMSQLNRR